LVLRKIKALQKFNHNQGRKMKKFKILFFVLFVLLLNNIGHATQYLPKDEGLVEQLKANNIRLVVMRNGKATNNSEDIVVSWRSPNFHLTLGGAVVVQKTAQTLVDDGIEIIYTSPLYRVLNTVQILQDILKLSYLKVIIDERLRQQDFGIFEGSTYHQYKNYFPSSEALYIQGAPGGESGKAIYARTRDLLWKIATSDEKNVLIVTHAFNIAYINRLLTGDFGQYPELGEYDVFDFSSP
jgi:broad specificity phosphatase PhoE